MQIKTHLFVYCHKNESFYIKILDKKEFFIKIKRVTCFVKHCLYKYFESRKILNMKKVIYTNGVHHRFSWWKQHEEFCISYLFLTFWVKLGKIYRFLFMGSCITSKQKHPRNRNLVFDIKLFSTGIICWKPEAIQSADTNLRRWSFALIIHLGNISWTFCGEQWIP